MKGLLVTSAIVAVGVLAYRFGEGWAEGAGYGKYVSALAGGATTALAAVALALVFHHTLSLAK